MPTMHKTKRTQPPKMVTIRIYATDRKLLKILAAEKCQTIATTVSQLFGAAK